MSVPNAGHEEPSSVPDHRALLRDMNYALLSEIGARSIYDHLGRRTRDEALGSVLGNFNCDGAEAIERLRALMIGLGANPPRTSLRRRVLARGLAATSGLTGTRLVLRICLNAEETVARWYAQYAIYFGESGDGERTRVCEELAASKRLHAQVLEAWVQNLRRS